MTNIAISLPTLESRLHEVNAIKSGTKLWNAGKVEFEKRDDESYWAHVEDRGVTRGVILKFTLDGSFFENHYCNCGVGRNGSRLCKHIVATVLAIQGGIIESKITIGKSATVTTTVTGSNTAKAVGSGSLEVFATPMMIALMERAACECLEDGLDPGQTSVGASIEVSHAAASPPGAKIIATATVEYVLGRKIEFIVAANDEKGEIGRGKHTRFLVDAANFTAKAETRRADH